MGESRVGTGVLLREFSIRKLPSRSQFYNLVGCIDPKGFNMIFIKWVEEIVKDDDANRTIAIDGKTICSTYKLSKGKGYLHILSAIMSENKLILGSMPYEIKINDRNFGYKWSHNCSYRITLHKKSAKKVVEKRRLLDCREDSENKTKVWNMNIQKALNIMRKIALNFAREYKNRFEIRKAISEILKRNPAIYSV